MSRIRGYTDRPAVAPGERIQLHVSGLDGAVRRPLRVFRVGLAEVEVAAGSIEVPVQPVPAQGWGDNRWNAAHALTVGRDWRPGVYVARIGEPADDTRGIWFVVRADPAAPPPIVVQLPTSTVNAYNNWGGKSLYGYNSGGEAGAAVSFDRPQQSDATWARGYGFEDEWELRLKALVQWLELAGIDADFMTSTDLHGGASLKPYRLFVSAGHDEYWSREMRDRVDGFIAGGGNVAIFGGNTCHWQVRFEPGAGGAPDRTQVCHKSAAADPCMDVALKTVKWRDVGWAENVSFGAGGEVGAWQGPGRPGAFTVTQPDHWVFAGTRLRRGEAFGNAADESVLRYETNGVRIARDRAGLPVPDGSDGTPDDYRILALAELADWGTPGNAALGVLERAGVGTVFNGATTEWARGLEACVAAQEPLRTTTAKITRNVIARLARQAGG